MPDVIRDARDARDAMTCCFRLFDCDMGDTAGLEWRAIPAMPGRRAACVKSQPVTWAMLRSSCGRKVLWSTAQQAIAASDHP